MTWVQWPEAMGMHRPVFHHTCYSLWWWDWRDQGRPVAEEWFSATILEETSTKEEQ